MTRNHNYIPVIGCFILFLSYSCEEIRREAKVVTGQAIEIKTTTARVTGDIIDLGEGIIEHGHCWSISPTPTIDDFKTELGTANKTGVYTSELTNLEVEMKYYIQGYATTEYGTVYGLEDMFETLPLFVTDYDGNVYQIVQIGRQYWLSENLKVTHYSDGTIIPLVEGNFAWEALTDKAYCYYDNSTSNRDAYGALYTWATAVNGVGSSNKKPSVVQGVCPTGWHLPSDAEWTELTDFLGEYSVAGGKLKEIGTAHWKSPNVGATNSSGFSALPGGFRSYYGSFNGLGSGTCFWSSNINAWSRSLSYYHSEVKLYYYYPYKNPGLSVRCIRD